MAKNLIVTTFYVLLIINIGLKSTDNRFWKPLNNITYDKCHITEVEYSVGKAIDYLYSAQLDYGEFKTYASQNRNLNHHAFDSSPFVTANVLYCIKDIDTEKTKTIKKKALEFLIDEQEPGGIWRYWTTRNSKRIDPDLDDISLISYILKINGIEFEDNLEIFQKYRNSDGLFFTWINQTSDNDVDCAVNAQVLLYLGDYYPDVCNFLNESVMNNSECSKYYPDRFFTYYFMARAFENNVDCLAESKKIIISEVLNSFKTERYGNKNLHCALGVTTLLIFDYWGTEINSVIEFLLNNQSKDGSWRRETAWLGPAPYYGSEELTTAFIIEALNKYLNTIKFQ